MEILIVSIISIIIIQIGFMLILGKAFKDMRKRMESIYCPKRWLSCNGIKGTLCGWMECEDYGYISYRVDAFYFAINCMGYKWYYNTQVYWLYDEKKGRVIIMQQGLKKLNEDEVYTLGVNNAWYTAYKVMSVMMVVSFVVGFIVGVGLWVVNG